MSCDFSSNRCTQCSLGYYRSSNTCLLIPDVCGDGLHFQLETCDDGNLVNGDGCSAKCRVEMGWNCMLQELQGPDICYRLAPPTISSFINPVYFDRVYLVFERPLKSTLNFSNITDVFIPELDAFKLLLIQVPDENGYVHVVNENSIFIPYEYVINQISSTIVEIIFTFKVTILNMFVSINFTNPGVVEDMYNWTLIGQEQLLQKRVL